MAGCVSCTMFSAQMFLSYNKIVNWPETAEWLFLVYIWILIPFVWPVAFGMLFLFEQSIANPLNDMKNDLSLIINHMFGRTLSMSLYCKKYII